MMSAPARTHRAKRTRIVTDRNSAYPSINMPIPRAHREQLQKNADALHISLSEYVRDMIAQHLENGWVRK